MASVVRIGSSGSIGSGEDSLGSAPAFNPIGVATAGCVRTGRGIAAAAPLREATTSALRRRVVSGDPGELPRGCDVDPFVMAWMGPCRGHTHLGGAPLPQADACHRVTARIFPGPYPLRMRSSRSSRAVPCRGRIGSAAHPAARTPRRDGLPEGRFGRMGPLASGRCRESPAFRSFPSDPPGLDFGHGEAGAPSSTQTAAERRS